MYTQELAEFHSDGRIFREYTGSFMSAFLVFRVCRY